MTRRLPDWTRDAEAGPAFLTPAPCHCGRPMPPGRVAYCSDRCRNEDRHIDRCDTEDAA